MNLQGNFTMTRAGVPGAEIVVKKNGQIEMEPGTTTSFRVTNSALVARLARLEALLNKKIASTKYRYFYLDLSRAISNDASIDYSIDEPQKSKRKAML